MNKAASTPFPAFDLSVMRAQGLAAFADVMGKLGEAAIAIDRDCKVAWFNEQYLDFIGLPPGTNLLGRDIREVFPATRLPKVIETGVAYPFEIMEVNGNWSILSRFPWKDPDTDEVVGAYGFILYKEIAALRPLTSRIDQLHKELTTTRAKLENVRRSKYSFVQFIGASCSVQELKWKAKQAAGTDATVLLQGETGTGKELLAQAIHAASSRQNENFVAINVAAVPEELLEAELFGTAPGAFTGADPKGRTGKMALANGGTIFLDEIADMPIRMQVKLLRALQEREVEPVGSNKVIPLNVRIIAATSQSLSHLVDDGRFRADLYYRLNVIPIAVPPLRDRTDDIPALADALLEAVCKLHGLPPKELTKSAYVKLKAHRWPGNVRELRNVIERACVLSVDSAIQSQDLDQALAGRGNVPLGGGGLHGTVSALERQLIADTLAKAHGNKLESARLLGISRSTLYKKLEHYGLEDELSDDGKTDTFPRRVR